MSELTPEPSVIHDELALETFRDQLRAWGQEEDR